MERGCSKNRRELITWTVQGTIAAADTRAVLWGRRGFYLHIQASVLLAVVSSLFVRFARHSGVRTAFMCGTRISQGTSLCHFAAFVSIESQADLTDCLDLSTLFVAIQGIDSQWSKLPQKMRADVGPQRSIPPQIHHQSQAGGSPCK